MKVYKEIIELESHGGRPSYMDITTEVRAIIERSGVKNGTCTVISPHTTCAVFFEEFAHDINEDGDEFLQEDLNNVLAKIIPEQTTKEVYTYPGELHYEEVEKWPNIAEYIPDGDRSALWNGDAHLRATIIGSSEVFDVDNGQLGVGTTGYVYFVDFDRARPRKRKCKVIVMGE